MTIHPTAIVDPSAQIAEQVTIGPYAIVGREVQLGTNTQIGAHCVIGDYTRMGRDCQVFSHGVIGSVSQDLKYRGEPSSVWLGDGNIVREFVTINRPTDGGQITRLGSHNLLMAYVHVAHDCQIGNHVILANSVNLGGYVEIEDGAVLGAMSGVHQFVRIGTLAMVGAMSKICNDIPPYMLAEGAPPKIYGLNVVGLRRAGINSETRRVLKQACQLLYRRQHNLTEALQHIEALGPSPEIQQLLTFMHLSKRGIISRFEVQPQLMYEELG